MKSDERVRPVDGLPTNSSEVTMAHAHSVDGIFVPTGLLTRALPRILGVWLLVAMVVTIAGAQGDENLLRRWLWATLVASLVGICVAVWWTAGIALQPVRCLTRRLQHLDARDEPRLDLEGPAEISELTRSLSDLLGQLHRSSVSREYLGTVLQAIPESLICVGPDGRIEDANRAAGRLLAAPADSLRGKPIEEVLPVDAALPGRRHGVVREIELMGTLRRGKTEMLDTRGRSLEVEVSGALLHDGDGTRRGMVLVAQPIG